MLRSFLFLLTVFQIGHCGILEDFTKFHVDSVQKNHRLSLASSYRSGFYTLSPELTVGISRSFGLLNECIPSLLQHGSYLEFGLYRGFSLWFAQQVGNTVVGKDFKYFGFDSFAGLPDQSQDYIGGAWAPGVYAGSLKEVSHNLRYHGADFSTLHLVKGWFGQQVFADWERQFNCPKAAIITIDADLYESCREILQFFSSFYIQPGTILLFDDFINPASSADINNFGERKALKEFLEEHKDFELTHLFTFSTTGYACMVTSCRGDSLDPVVLKKVKELNGDTSLPSYLFF
jgi:hypothetical protein